MHQFSLAKIPAEERVIADFTHNGEDDAADVSLIGGRYRLRSSLGTGTFGEVFLADDLKFDPPRAVAIKILHRKFLNEPGTRNDIAHEASILARFSHPNIIRVLDFDITPKLSYIVTELAEGGSLARIIRPDPTRPSVRQPLVKVARYLEQISDALDEAHAQGLIHRDLKPLNILLDKRNRPLIADFGMATAVNNSQSSVVIEAKTSGTPPYMAPEQWMGQVGRASDNYSLGIIVFQLITGQVPYQGEQAALGFQHLNAPIPKLSDRAPDLIYPPALDDVLAGILAKDPRQRTRPATEFFHQFQTALGLSGSLVNFSQSLPTLPPLAVPAGAEATVSGPFPAMLDPSADDPSNSPTQAAGFERASSNPSGSGPNFSSTPPGSTPPGSTPPDSFDSLRPGSKPPRSIKPAVPAESGWSVRNWILLGTGALVVVAILVVAIVFSLGGKPNPPPTQVAAAPTNTASITAPPSRNPVTPGVSASARATTPGGAATTAVPTGTTAVPVTGSNPKTTSAGNPSPTPGNSKVADSTFIEVVKMDSTGKPGGQLKYAYSGNGPNILNPYFADGTVEQRMAQQVFAPLVGQSANAKYYPYLLASVPTLNNNLVKVAPDNKTMTVTLQLKPNAKWSDGSPLTSADLKYTWQWVTDKTNTGLQGDGGGWSAITDIDTPNPGTAVVKFKTVYGPYLQWLTTFYPLPQAVWSKIPFKDNGPARSPEATKPSVNSGPFVVEEYAAKDHVTFARNNNFAWVWGFNAYLDKLVFQWTEGSTASSKAFEAGSLDLVDALTDGSVETATKAASKTGKFEITQGSTWQFLQFNLGNPVLQDKNVRQALLMGLDRDALIKQFASPQSVPLATTCNPLSLYCAPNLKVYNYDVGTAKKLLSDAGWDVGSDGTRVKNGNRLTVSLNTTTSTGVDALANGIVAAWKEIGVEGKVVTAPSGQFFAGWNNNGVLKRGNYDVALYSFSTDLDPHGSIYTYASVYIPSDATKGSGTNYGRINDPKIDADFDTERKTVDLGRRMNAFHDLYQVLYDNVYEAALYSHTNNHLVSNKLHNFKANPTDDGNLWNSVELWVDH